MKIYLPLYRIVYDIYVHKHRVNLYRDDYGEKRWRDRDKFYTESKEMKTLKCLFSLSNCHFF